MIRPPLPLVTLDEDQLANVTASTLRHYDTHAERFWLGTRDHDVSQNISALLRHLPAVGPQRILDLGCGPGRDLLTFRDLGHQVTGLDGSQAFVEAARERSGCEVLCQNLLTLDLPAAHFDGIFANAVLFHVPSQALGGVLESLWRSLRAGGALFSSNPHGENREGWSGERYGTYLDLETYRRFMTAAGFVELESFYRPTGEPRERQPWLASVWRKPDAK